MSRESTLASVTWTVPHAPDAALCDAAELAGRLLAHAVWCMSEEDEGPFAPTIAYEGADGRRFLMFDDEDYDAALRNAKAWLEQNPARAVRAVLVYDGCGDRKAVPMDALVAEVMDHAGPRSFLIILPYRPAATADGFAVFGARFALGDIDFDQAPLLAAFGRGIGAHEEAAQAWINHFDNTA
jgi:hypothetical protein